MVLSILLLLPPLGGQAQTAEVVRPDAQGDFRAIRFASARGWLPQRFWLVVDRDPAGLRCRDELGRALIALRDGAIVQLDRPDQQLTPLWIDARPHLRVSVDPIAILEDTRLRQRGKTTVCRVRANSAFVSPIQLESLQQTLIRP